MTMSFALPAAEQKVMTTTRRPAPAAPAVAERTISHSSAAEPAAPALAGMESLLTAVFDRPVRLRAGRPTREALRLVRIAA